MFSVPSKSIKIESIFFWFKESSPIKAGLIISLTLLTAFKTPFPKNLSSLSLNSKASLWPVEAPLGKAISSSQSKTALSDSFLIVAVYWQVKLLFQQLPFSQVTLISVVTGEIISGIL